MRKAAVLMISSLVLLLFVGGMLIQSLLIMQRVAAVSDARGSILIKPRGAATFAPLGGAERVKAGDVIQTGPDGQVTLHWIDNSRLRIGPNSVVEVLKCQFNHARQTEQYLFRLSVGQVWVRVLQALKPQDKFEIRTPTATAAVRGTVFSVAVAPDGTTTVSVLKGKVTLTGSGQETAVNAGQEARASASGSAFSSTMTEASRFDWERNLDIAEPSLQITAPVSDRIPQGLSTLTVEGIAERQSEVTVNGQPVKLSPKGQFSTEIAVPKDAREITITVRAVDPKGFQKVVTRRLERSTTPASS
jgi:hypothetical protein